MELKTDSPISEIKRESKTKRVNLLIRPTTYKLAQAECAKLGISLNEAINQLLENWTTECLLNKKGKESNGEQGKTETDSHKGI